MNTRFDRINNEDKPAAPKKKRTKPGWTRHTAKKLVEKPVPVEPPKSFEDKLRDNDYMSKLPYPHVRSVNRLRQASRTELAEVAEARRQREAYHADQARLEAEFKADMFANYGVTGHPKAQRAYEIAWSHGHASGFSDVDSFFSEIVDLLLP